MTKRKLNLESLEVSSFILNLDQRRVLGGCNTGIPICPIRTITPGCTDAHDVSDTDPETDDLPPCTSNYDCAR